MIRLTVIFGFLFATISGLHFNNRPGTPPTNSNNYGNYQRNRAILLVREFEMSLGYNLTLSPMEELANEVITKAKLKEIDEGFFNPSNFTPAYKFPETLRDIRESSVYQLVKTMPKGGILHSHDTALGSSNILVILTYKRFCWICIHMDGSLEFTFSRNQPNATKTCERWQLMKDYRSNGGMSDEELSKYFKLNTTRNYRDVNEVWAAFEPLFGVANGIIGFTDNFEEYIRRTLRELLDDGVQYVELRSSLRGVSFEFYLVKIVKEQSFN